MVEFVAQVKLIEIFFINFKQTLKYDDELSARTEFDIEESCDGRLYWTIKFSREKLKGLEISELVKIIFVSFIYSKFYSQFK
jgi:hypothetical protein